MREAHLVPPGVQRVAARVAFCFYLRVLLYIYLYFYVYIYVYINKVPLTTLVTILWHRSDGRGEEPACCHLTPSIPKQFFKEKKNQNTKKATRLRISGPRPWLRGEGRGEAGRALP